jgi:hypothetical protein
MNHLFICISSLLFTSGCVSALVIFFVSISLSSLSSSPLLRFVLLYLSPLVSVVQRKQSSINFLFPFSLIVVFIFMVYLSSILRWITYCLSPLRLVFIFLRWITYFFTSFYFRARFCVFRVYKLLSLLILSICSLEISSTTPPLIAVFSPTSYSFQPHSSSFLFSVWTSLLICLLSTTHFSCLISDNQSYIALVAFLPLYCKRCIHLHI